MTTWNAFEHDGFNGFRSIGYNARNGGVSHPDLYLVTDDQVNYRLLKLNGGKIIWSRVIPGSNQTSRCHPDLTINEFGIYTSVPSDGINPDICRWSRIGELLNSATYSVSAAFTDPTVCSNHLGEVFLNYTAARKYDHELNTLIPFGGGDRAQFLNALFSRRSACSPQGDPFFAVVNNGGGGGYARGWRRSDLAQPLLPSPILGVRESLNQGLQYRGIAPCFNTASGVSQGFSMSTQNNFLNEFQVGYGRGVDFSGLISSDTTGPKRSRLFSLPTYLSTPGGLISYSPNGTKIERWTGYNPGELTWSIEVEDIFTSLPRGEFISNIAYGLLAQAGDGYGYVWGASINQQASTHTLFVGEANLASQTQAWLVMNTDDLVAGLLGAVVPGFEYGIGGAVIDQPGEGYSNPTLY